MSSMYFFGVFFFGAAFVLVAILWIARDNHKNRKLVGKAEEEREELLSIIEDAELMVHELNNFSDYILSKIEEKNAVVGDSIEKLEEKLEAVRGDRENSENCAERGNREDHRNRADCEDRSNRGGSSGRTADRTPVYRLKKRAGAAEVAEAVDLADHAEAATAAETATKAFVADAKTEEETEEAAADTTEEISEEEQENLPEASSGAPIIVFSRKDGDNIVPEYHKNRVKYENRKYKQVLQYAQEGLSESEIAQCLNIGKGEVRLILGLTESEATSRI